MTDLNAYLDVVDNSGPKIVKLIGIIGKKRKRLKYGDIVRVSVVSSISKNIPEGSKKYAVVCMLKSSSNRGCGMYKNLGGLTVRTSRNAVAILADDRKKWLGTSVKTMVAEEVRAIAPEVVSKSMGVF